MTEIQAQPNSGVQRDSAEQQYVNPDLEKFRGEAEKNARKALDKDAGAAIDRTLKAIDAIAAGKTSDALRFIEEATGTVDILLARNQRMALIPVNAEALIIDSAPRDIDEIGRLTDLADAAFSLRDYPGARALLDRLRSEIRIRTYHLPLGIYPTALHEAARLLDQDPQASSRALLAALRTLVASDQVIPIPLLIAQAAINQAQSQSQKDKSATREALESAQFALNRAKVLGYNGRDSEYTSLKNEISALRKQLRGSEDTALSFSRLRAKLGEFLKRQSDRRAGSASEESSKQAA